jgi:poly(hydroxyalkanoate) depolymerase family esterase
MTAENWPRSGMRRAGRTESSRHALSRRRRARRGLVVTLSIVAFAVAGMVAATGSATAASVPAFTTSLPGGGYLPSWVKYLPGAGLAWGASGSGASLPGGSTSTTSGSGSSATAVATPGGTFSGTFSGSGESINYRGYVPTSYNPSNPVPLVVALHGCTESADQFRQLTRWDQLAEVKGFIVVFPEQTKDNNQFTCWNWFQQAHMQRGSGEPALIAGVTQRVEQQYTINPHHVYVAGFSAGGAMASVMAATYPDLYAAAGIGDGCEYAATAACAGYKGTDPTSAGQQAYQAMGSYARAMPVIAFQGDQDNIVPPANGQQLVEQWMVTDSMADGGSANSGTSFFGSTPAKVSYGQVQNGRSYTVNTYNDSHGNERIQYWLVRGMSHAWSGGCGCEQYSDPAGPDETSAMYAFFQNHPMP